MFLHSEPFNTWPLKRKSGAGFLILIKENFFSGKGYYLFQFLYSRSPFLQTSSFVNLIIFSPNDCINSSLILSLLLASFDK